MPVDPDKREEFLGKVAKSFEKSGGNVIRGPELTATPQVRLPFVSPMLTWATTGGVPWGHIVRSYGPEHSGKSLTNWGLLWCAQNYHYVLSEQYERECKILEAANKRFEAKVKRKELKALLDKYPDKLTAMIWDTEGRVEGHFLEQLGLDMSLIDISDQTVVELICAGIRDGWESFHIQIIDSASAAESLEEAGLKVGDYARASSPRAWTQWMKKARKKIDRNENVLIVVDQMRGNLGKMGAAQGPPGINYLRHAASLTLEFASATKLYRDKNGLLTDDWEKADSDIKSLGTDGKEPHGVQMGCKVTKNSTGRPWRNAWMRFSFPVYNVRTGELQYPVGFDETFELLEIAKHFDIIDQGGGGMYYVLDDEFERNGDKYKGESAMRVAIADDEELTERIMTRVHRDR